MDEYGISDRDAFLAHAIGFDADDNNYLNKGELTAAADAWGKDDADSGSEDSDEGNDSDDADDSDEASGDDNSEDVSEGDDSDSAESDDSEPEEDDSGSNAEDGELVCEICTTKNPAGSATCSTCGFVFPN